MSKLSKETLALGAGFVFFSLAIALVAGYVFSIKRATARTVQKTTKVTASAPSRVQGAAVRREGGLRVCADPNDLPFSNEHRQGFENKIAALLGRDLGEPVEYTWWSERQNFVRNTLEAGRCDIVMGLPEGMPGALTTAPYYRSVYVFAYRKDRKFGIRSLNDPLLRRLRIGVNVVGNDYAPPAAPWRRGALSKMYPATASSEATRIKILWRGLSMPLPAAKSMWLWSGVLLPVISPGESPSRW